MADIKKIKNVWISKITYLRLLNLAAKKTAISERKIKITDLADSLLCAALDREKKTKNNKNNI